MGVKLAPASSFPFIFAAWFAVAKFLRLTIINSNPEIHISTTEYNKSLLLNCKHSEKFRDQLWMQAVNPGEGGMMNQNYAASGTGRQNGLRTPMQNRPQYKQVGF